MKQSVYSIFDLKTVTYSPPFYAVTNGSAVRMVQDVVADLNTALGRHPKDYVLYRLGEWDDQTGIVSMLDIREHVVDLISLVKTHGDLFGDDRTAANPSPIKE